MAVVVVHDFESAKGDGADPTQIQPSHWNAGHTVTGLGPLAEASLVETAHITDLNVTEGKLADGAVATSKLASAALKAIAVLTPAANKLAYFTSSTVAALIDLTAAGRALLDDADAAAQLVTLGAKGIAPSAETMTDQASTTFDAKSGRTEFARLTATGNRTISAPTNPIDGQKVLIEHTASGADRTLALATGSNDQFIFGSDVTALSATASGKTDVIGAVYNLAQRRWRVVGVAKGF